jgi:capsular polysaccharide biosynthesis protein
MDLFRYFVRFLYKIRWYLVILPMIALIVAWFMTRNMQRIYDTNTTIYTGMITGYNIEGGSGAAGGNSQTNITNLMLIITTDNTIHEVALRLFARCMMYGNPNKDNNYISAEHFRQLSATVPADVKALINHNSESATYANLKAYEKPSQDNFLFGLMNYHPYFGINSITSRLKVLQLQKSDIIDIGYSANDAGIAYNTLDILNDVFARQYQQLRYGETNNVIKFFEREVARLYRILTSAEDDLIRYNVSKRIINYAEQTKQVASLEAQQQNFRNDQLMNYTTSKALLDYLERQLGNRAQVIRSNREFTNQVRDISRIQSRISNLKLMSSEGGGNNNESQEELAKAQRDLQRATGRVSQLTKDIEAATFSTETGVKAQDMLGRWLEQLLLLEKTKAEMTATDIMQNEIDRQYLFYAPIGATLDRKSRHIGFIEGNYMEMLKSLNAARMRQRNLQMSTATLRVLNPPMFPLNAQPTNRLMVLLGAFMLTFALTTLYFMIIEMLDRTLRDRMRSERITEIPVMGCFPKESNLRYRRFNKTIADMALKQLSKALLPNFKEGQQNVLNLLSTDSGNGKSYIAQELENYWISIGLQVRRLTYDEDFLAEDSKFILAKDIKDLCPDILPDEIAIIEYPNLDDYSISPALLNMGTINMMVTRANRTWKDVDQKALKEVQAMLDEEHKNTLFMYLTEATRYAVEEFVGQLPPYTKFNNFVYRMSQLGLTATENEHAL